MRRSGWCSLATAAALAACQPGAAPMTDAQRQAVAQEVQAQVDSFVAAFHQMNAQPYLDQLANNESYAENAAFYPTRDSLLRAAAQFPKTFTTLTVTLDGTPRITVLAPDAAVFSTSFHEEAQPATGAPLKLHGTWTGVYQRINGKWQIVQAHESFVPDVPDQPVPTK